ncbi:MAG TPA: tetratricopeptide repeat protein [Chthoniobacterales bacterium]
MILSRSLRQRLRAAAAVAVVACPVFLSPLTVSAQDQSADAAVANQLLNDGNYESAAQAFEQFVANYPTSTIIADAQLKLGFSQMLLQKNDEAIANFKKLLVPPAPNEIIETASGLLPQALAQKAGALPPEDAGRKAAFDAAIKAFTDFIAKYPKSDLIENSRYTQAICYFQTQQYDPAIENLRANLRDFPKSESVLDSQYLLALMLATKASALLNANRGETAVAFPLFDEAQKLLTDIITKRSDLPLVSDSQFQLGEVLFSRAIFTQGAERSKLLTDSLAAYRSIEANDVVLREQEAKIESLKARAKQALMTKDIVTNRRLQSLVGRETAKIGAIKNKASQTVGARLKMAQIFFQLSTPTQPRYDEARVLLDYLEPFANETEKKTIAYFRTMTYALQGNVDKAVAGYDSFQSRYKGDPVAENLPVTIGAMFTTSNPPQPEKALAYFKAQVEQYPKSAATAAALVEQANAYGQLQQFEQAIKTYEDYLATKPEKALALRAQLGLADIYKSTGKLDEADQVYATIQKDYADTPDAVKQSSFWHGWILVQQQKYQDATTALATFNARYPDDQNLTPLAYFTLAQAQEKSGAVATAMKTFQQVVEKFPKSQVATFTFFERQRMATEAGDTAAADAAMREFIAAYPQDPKVFNAYANLAQTQVAQNKPQDAINIYYEFIDKNVQSPLVPQVLLQTSANWLGIAQTLGRYAGLTSEDRDKWTKAVNNSIGDAERVVEKYPESPDVATAVRGILKAQKELVDAQLKKREDVESYFTQFAAKLDSTPKAKSKVLFTLASFIYETDKAKALQQMTAAYDPNLVYASSDLDLYGEALLDQNKIDEAEKVFQKVAADYQNPPGNAPNQVPLPVQEAQAISLFGTGKVLQARGQTAEAAATFEELKQRYPWSSKIFEANYGIASGLFNEKKYDEALALVEGIVRAQTATNELRAKAMILGGKIRLAAGDLGGAIDYFIKTDYFYGGVPSAAAEGLFLGAQAMEAQAPTLQKPEDKQKMQADAIKYYKQIGEKYPESPFAPQAAERLKALGAS